MAVPRYSIGIDLGTTNTALAFVALAGVGPSEMLSIPQLESAVAIVEAPTLPSFLYLPHDTLAPADTAAADEDERWVIGRLARANAAETPGRVVHSAKSWLVHHSADRLAPFLPWGSEDVARDDKVSPVRASALVLRYVREAWNDRFAADGGELTFNKQVVTITVPASFDEVAQRLTLEAARAAGYPDTVRLLEEPQAALYRWLELQAPADVGWQTLGAGGAQPRHVLVVDIGGGTSDFSLFAFHANAGAEPRIERIAVSEHILLGGDNMDLALAHRLEPQLVDDGESLSGRQWEYLVARCRDVKESALAQHGPSDATFNVAIPGRGSRLIAQANSAWLSRAEVEGLLLDGFFPECSAEEYPIRTKAGLRELGLPYARDPAVTRHLADFLRDRPYVDAVLFNGGALHPESLRHRIVTQIAKWQSGRVPAALHNAEPDLAVARGAARFGKLVHTRAQRIEAGAAHSIFLQATRTADDPQNDDSRTLVCVLPQGAPSEQLFTLTALPLELRVNRPVRFQTYSSARNSAGRAGDIVVWNDREFVSLPALETSIVAGTLAGETIPVRLTANVSELGRLQIACLSTDARIPGSWPLTFDLRAAGPNESTDVRATATNDARDYVGPNVASDKLEAARHRMSTLFERRIDTRDKLTATRLVRSLEQILGTPRSAWNAVLVRSLWSTLDQCMGMRRTSIDHEESWLIVAGFLLRPGFGVPMDDLRIDRLWTLHESGLCFSAKTVRIQQYVLWRRVAGGLSRERQASLIAPELATIHEQHNPPPELVLLAGSLERLPPDVKSELIHRFIEVASTLERAEKHNAHFFAALGSLLSRAPLYSGPEVVVSPGLVQRAFESFSNFDWDGPKHLDLQTLFLRAGRVVDNRAIDLPRSLRNRIADKLERAGVAAAKTAAIKDYIPMQRAEQLGSFGEALPAGLILRGQGHV